VGITTYTITIDIKGFCSYFFHIIGIFAELEDNTRAERQKIGIRRVLENGAKFGRKSIMSDKLIKSVADL
jgi:DNA invertase Pin-like site-specific DNA recombinase